MEQRLAKTRKIISMVLVIVMAMSLWPPVSVQAADKGAITFYKSIAGTLTDAEVTTQLVAAGVGPGDTFSVAFDESVTALGDMAFFGRTGLTGVVIEDGVTGIGPLAFSLCTGLTDVVIGDSVTGIGDGAFSACTGLTSVVMGNSVTGISYSAFSGCSSLISVVIPGSVASIGDMAFFGCTGLLEVCFNGDAPSVGVAAFSATASGAAAYVNRSATGFPAESAHWNGLIVKYREDGNKTITFHTANPDGTLTDTEVTTQLAAAGAEPGDAFSAAFDESVTAIAAAAFANCYGLTSLNISDGVTDIGSGAFSGCYNLEAINVSPDNRAYSSINGVMFTKDRTVLVLCPEGKSGDYAIPDNVKSIGNYAFRSCIGLGSVVIPDSVKTIGNGAFWGCGGYIPDEDTIEYPIPDLSPGMEIEIDGPGDYYYGLSSICIGKGLESIGGSAFWGCANLTGVVIPDGVTSIGGQAFSYTRIETITLPPSVSSFGVYENNGPFFGMDYLESVVFEPGTAAIRNNAFAGISGTVKVFAPKSVVEVSPDSGLGEITTVYGFARSYAEEYAKENGIPFVTMPTVLADGLPVAYQYLPYSFLFASSDGSWLEVTDDSQDELPEGMQIALREDTLDGKHYLGEIWGVPLESGKKFRITVRATDGNTYPLEDEECDFTVEILPRLFQTGLDEIINNGLIDKHLGIYDPEEDIYVLEIYDTDPEDEIIIFDCEYEDFIALWIDGVLQKRDVAGNRDGDYFAEEGSTVITVYGQTLGKLNPNTTHVIAGEFKSGGKATGDQYKVAENFKIDVVPRPDPNPDPKPNPRPKPDSESIPDKSPPTAQPLTTPPVAPTPAPVIGDFLDIKETDWFFADVAWAYQNGIMLGVSPTRFAPYEAASPAMLSVTLARMSGVDLNDYRFVGSGWFSPAMAWTRDLGLFDGIGPLAPGMQLDRGQLSIIFSKLVRSAEPDISMTDGSFTASDEDLMSAEELDAFKLLSRLGILQGKGNGIMDPRGILTRAELAAVLHRADKYATEMRNRLDDGYTQAQRR